MKTRYAFALSLAAIALQAAQIAHAASEGGDTWTSVAAMRSTAKGTPMAAKDTDRVIELGTSTSNVDVLYGERILFKAQDGQGSERAFAWRFDVMPSNTHVDIGEIAPTGFPVRNVRVFVAPQPEYRGG